MSATVVAWNFSGQPIALISIPDPMSTGRRFTEIKTATVTVIRNKSEIESRCQFIQFSNRFKRDNVRAIPDAGDVETVGADIIAKLSAETSRDRSVAAWDQRPVMRRLALISLFFGHTSCAATLSMQFYQLVEIDDCSKGIQSIRVCLVEPVELVFH